MSGLLVGLWAFSLIIGIARHRRRNSVVVLPIVLVPIAPELAQDDESWLRRQLDQLEPR
jgi:hypothetical protein